MALYADAGDLTGVAGCRHSLGDLALAEHDLAAVFALYHQALECQAGSISEYEIAHTIAGLAACVAPQQPTTAARLWNAVRRLEEQQSRRLHESSRAIYTVPLDHVASGIADVRPMTLDEAVELAHSLQPDGEGR
jgi:hypothetical protein